MKYLWALPAALRLVLAANQPFSVHNDILAYPQFEIIYSETYIPARDAETQLRAHLDRQAATGDQHDLSQVYKEQHVNPLDDKFALKNETVERMILDGRSFLCRIPVIPPDTSDNTTASDVSEKEQQQELMRASDHGWELLRSMQGQCLYYVAGWWAYSFCFNDGVKQFHALPARGGMPRVPLVEDQGVQSYMLGQVPKSDDARSAAEQSLSSDDSEPTGTDVSSQLQTRGETKYLAQTLEGGSVCDLTGQERKIEVQFHCNPGSQDQITLIKETASCVYLMVVQTPRLCNDVAFLPAQAGKAHPITCQVILTPEEEAEWKSLKTEAAARDLFSTQSTAGTESHDAASPPMIIGGIEVGAQIYVGGSPERTIKASNIIKPPKQRVGTGEEKYIATLAKSDGKYTTLMSEHELKKHGLNRQPDEISELIKNIQEWAGDGQPWKLDIMQTPQGMEFRGMLLDATKDDSAKANEGDSPKAKGDSEDKEKRKSGDEHAGSDEEYKQAP